MVNLKLGSGVHNGWYNGLQCRWVNLSSQITIASASHALTMAHFSKSSVACNVSFFPSVSSLNAFERFWETLKIVSDDTRYWSFWGGAHTYNKSGKSLHQEVRVCVRLYVSWVYWVNGPVTCIDTWNERIVSEMWTSKRIGVNSNENHGGCEQVRGFTGPVSCSPCCRK